LTHQAFDVGATTPTYSVTYARDYQGNVINKTDGTMKDLYDLNYNSGINRERNVHVSFTMVFSRDYTTLYGTLFVYGQDPSNNNVTGGGILFSFNIITKKYTILNDLKYSYNSGKFISSLVLSNDGNILYGISEKYPFQYNLLTGILSPIFNGFINNYARMLNLNYGWSTGGKVNPKGSNDVNYTDNFQLTLNGRYLVGYCYKDYNKSWYQKNVPSDPSYNGIGSNESFIYTIDLLNSDINNNSKILFTFDGSNNKIYGVNAVSAPMIGADGKMYGFTISGGLNNYGTFYSLDLSGNTNVLYHFNSITQGILQLNSASSFISVYINLSADKRTFYSSARNGNSVFSIDICGNFSLLYNNTNTINGYYIGQEVLTIDNQNRPNFYFVSGSPVKFVKYYFQDPSWNVNILNTYTKQTLPNGSINSTIYNNYQTNYLFLEGGFPSAQVCVATDNRNIYAITNNSLVRFDNHGNNFTNLFSFVFDPNYPNYTENPCCLIYNSANNKLYGVNYGRSDGSNDAYGNGSLFSYNLSTNVYTSIYSFSERCINIILNHKKTIIYGLNSIYKLTSSFWSYDISNNIISTITQQGRYFENSNITITKNDSTIYCTYFNSSIGTSVLVTIDTATSTYTDNVYVFSSILNVGTLTLSQDETLLYGIRNNTIFSYRIATKTITNLYSVDTGTIMSPLVLGGSKNNNHILYGTLTNISASGSPTIYSYDTLFNTFSVIYNYGGTNLNSSYYVYPEKGGSPLGSILYANKDTIITTTYGGGTYELGAIVKIRIHYPEAPCFLEGTRVLCLDEVTNQMVYIPVQHIRKGMKVKTCKHGFVPVNMIGVSEIENEGSERIMNRLYRLKQTEYADLFDDLVITGCHSVLVDGLTHKQIQDTLQIFDMVFMTDDKYRLLACLDENAQPYEKSGDFTIYHIALDHADYFMNYGIYANGLLVESCSQRYLKELSGMRLIE
jgi:uncharacterized repeat protein (TIGR03803 family)